MNIALDVSPLETGHNGRGVGVYTKLLIESLQVHHREHTYTFFTHTHSIPENIDVVHYPYFDPYFLTLPIVKRFPTVVTIHDLIPRKFSKYFPSGVKGFLKWQIQKLALSRAQRVITDSKCSKKDIIDIARIADDVIDVVYLAPSIPRKIKDTPAFAEVSKKYGIKKSYLLYVGDVNWNKNVLGLIEAFSTIKKTRLTMQLVLVGRAFLNTTVPEVKQILSLIQTLQIQNSVIFTGYVENNEIVKLFENAECLIQPSFYEGFGFSVVDALSHNCIVITSDASSLPEISGPAMQVNAQSTQSIAGGIQTVLHFSEKEKKVLKAKGMEWVKQFSWEKVARQTIESYTRAVL